MKWLFILRYIILSICKQREGFIPYVQLLIFFLSCYFIYLLHVRKRNVKMLSNYVAMEERCLGAQVSLGFHGQRTLRDTQASKDSGPQNPFLFMMLFLLKANVNDYVHEWAISVSGPNSSSALKKEARAFIGLKLHLGPIHRHCLLDDYERRSFHAWNGMGMISISTCKFVCKPYQFSVSVIQFGESLQILEELPFLA